MRYTTCNFCGRDHTRLVNEGPDLYLRRPGLYRLVQCQGCGLIYQNPQPTREELLTFYPTDAYELYVPGPNQERSTLARLDRAHGQDRRCRRILKYGPSTGRLLDVGCATGAFLNAMRGYGWEVAGVELNPEAAAYARQTYGLTIYTGVLEEAPLPDKSLDVITLWDVWEHVLDPSVTLNIIRRLLKPGGWVVISTPNPLGLEARLFGDCWAGWDRPRHLHLFSPAVLRAYLQRTGFERILFDNFSGRWRVTLLSLSYWSQARGIPDRYARPLLQAAYNWPLRLLTWPVYRLGEHFNQTTNQTCFAQLPYA